MKRTLTLLVLAAVSVACNGDGDTTILQLLSPQDSSLLIQAHDGDPAFLILDVRTPGEHSAGYIEDAQNIDYMDAGFTMAVSALDRDGVYLVYCQSGARSANAARDMAGLGFVEIYDLDGGYAAWVAAGLPTVK